MQAVWPGDEGERPRAGERKKFCMSMITSADFAGSMVVGAVVVCRVILGSVGEAPEGAERPLAAPLAEEEGRDRSKPVWEEWSQKFVLVPMKALRCGSDGMVEVEAILLFAGLINPVWLS